MVLSPSVFFTGDDLVLQKMLPAELMDAYNVEVSIQDYIKEANNQYSCPPLLSFVMEVPGRLLTSVDQAVLKRFLHPDKVVNEMMNEAGS